ncbi:hypothetical protein PG984_003246 [Apiospora sp. TS-2023a]
MLSKLHDYEKNCDAIRNDAKLVCQSELQDYKLQAVRDDDKLRPAQCSMAMRKTASQLHGS